MKSERPSATVSSSIFFEGDRLIFRKNDSFLRVKNGECGTIERVFNSGNITVRLDSGERRHFDPKSYDQVTLAYASTTHKAQGQTKDKTYILVDDGMIDKEMFYVQISRQRFDVRLFINGQGEERVVAYNEFPRRVSKSNQEVLAHDLAKKLREEDRIRAALESEKREMAPITEVKIKEPEGVERAVSARDIADWYTKEVYHPANAQEVALKRRLHSLQSIDPRNWEEHIKEIIFDGEYKKTQSSLESAEYNLRQQNHRHKMIIHEGKKRGWLHRTVSRDYKESLQLAETEIRVLEEKHTALLEKKEEFDRFLNSWEGKRRYEQGRVDLERKNNEIASERAQVQGAIDDLGLYQILGTLSQLSALKDTKLSLKQGANVLFDRLEIEEKCRTIRSRAPEQGARYRM